MKNANFPIDPDGHTYHLYAKHGYVANRVITVGDLARAYIFARTPGFRIRFVQ